jgi:hypothetical protein
MESRSEYLSFDTAEELLEEFDAWFFTYLPASFRYSKTDTIWKSRFTCLLNLLYLSNKIDILVPFFLGYLEGEGKDDDKRKYYLDMMESVAIVSVICRSFIDYKSHGGMEEPLRNSNLLIDTVFRGALILEASLLVKQVSEQEEVRNRVLDHAQLLRLVHFELGDEKESSRLEDLIGCLKEPQIAINRLKSRIW